MTSPERSDSPWCVERTTILSPAWASTAASWRCDCGVAHSLPARPCLDKTPRSGASARGAGEPPSLEAPGAATVQQRTDGDEQDPRRQETEIPAQRSAEVVPDVVDAEHLVVDQPLDQVEQTPPDQDEPGLEAPAR